jgi:ribosome-associated protein
VTGDHQDTRQAVGDACRRGGHPYAGMEDPMELGRGVRVPLSEVTVRTSRSSGPGGQHANVTSSRVEAIFDVAASAALSAEQKRRVIARCGPRVRAVAQDARGQARNRELALERLRRRLSAALVTPRRRVSTRPTKASVGRRLDAKRRQGQRKRERRPPGESGDA